MRKHLLILLALVAALSLVFVACDKTPDQPADTTASTDAPTEEPTDAPTEPESEDVTEPATEEGTTAAPETQEPETQEPETQEPETQEPETQEPETQAPETEEPETEPQVPHYDNYNVPQDQWTVSGHCPEIVGSEGHANSPMVAAGGVASGALLHQGSISLGEIDLSKYEKVVIYFGVDNSDVTWGRYNENANNRIMLVSADTHLTNSPAEETIIAGATYEPCGWAVVAFEIDLTDVDYNGPVFVTYDTLPGTFMLFSEIEFIGAEMPAPAEPTIVDLTTVGITGSYPTVDVPINAGSLGLTEGHVITLHYGSINLGEMDLSQYSKVTVTYATPCGVANGQDMNAEYEATGKRVLLLNAPSAIQEGSAFELLPAEDAIVTTAPYEISPTYSQIMTVEIDLTNVDYNGQLYLSFDFRNADNAFGALGYLVFVTEIAFA